MNSTSLGLSSAAGCSPVNRHTVVASPVGLKISRWCYRRSIRCSVAVRSTNSTLSSSTTVEEEEDEAQRRAEKKIGAKVRVKVPLKMYHVPRVPEVDLTGKEGELKQYVGLWKGKRISANYPYKVQFVVDIEGRGPVKFFSHLKEDEFDSATKKLASQ
ncbi:ferredoxin/thioredoxin reductase subunit A (variable subunit) 2 [Euphorbia peplus]|nr:ferredoxin/thioredoxin reductase subunit A (variable subunit) 2 [Euphorbia peplus]